MNYSVEFAESWESECRKGKLQYTPIPLNLCFHSVKVNNSIHNWIQQSAPMNQWWVWNAFCKTGLYWDQVQPSFLSRRLNFLFFFLSTNFPPAIVSTTVPTQTQCAWFIVKILEKKQLTAHRHNIQKVLQSSQWPQPKYTSKHNSLRKKKISSDSGHVCLVCCRHIFYCITTAHWALLRTFCCFICFCA